MEPMNAIARLRGARNLAGLTLLFAACAASAQQFQLPTAQRSWDINVWIAGATGEENTNSFTEAGIRTAGFLVGKVLTGEVGRGWRRGTWEYGFDFVPLFATAKNQKVKGAGFEPVVLRWNSSHHAGPVVPYIEMAGGGMFTTANVPPGNTSSVNFTARGGGGIQVIVRNRQSLDFGCYWSHLSNANLGVDNPEFNGIRVSLGYHWFK
jgi:Lipid A 3-O-deacylase (PagL)